MHLQTRVLLARDTLVGGDRVGLDLDAAELPEAMQIMSQTALSPDLSQTTPTRNFFSPLAHKPRDMSSVLTRLTSSIC